MVSVYGDGHYSVIHGDWHFIRYDDGGEELYNLSEDPHEWNNLAGKPGCETIEQDLKARILENFDPDTIEKEVLSSLYRRDLIRKAMVANDTVWDHYPTWDARKNSLSQYL